MEKQDGLPHIADQKQDGQLEHTYSSSVRIRDFALKTCQKRWTIGGNGDRGSGRWWWWWWWLWGLVFWLRLGELQLEFMCVILQDTCGVVHIPFVGMVKFKFLAHFPVDHLAHPVASSLILLSRSDRTDYLTFFCYLFLSTLALGKYSKYYSVSA